MRTYRFINRHGREVSVGQDSAVLLFRNPSMKYVGEEITTTEIKDVPKTRKILVEKFKYVTKGGKKERVPVEVEEIEEYTEKEMTTTTYINSESTPFSVTDDISITQSGTIKQRTVVNSAGNATKQAKHLMLDH